MNKAKWISYDRGEFNGATDKHGNPSPVFRKVFYVKDGVKSVKVYASALGVFKAYLNGNEIDNDILMPGWTPYQSYINLTEYDITGKCGQKNAIAFVLGDGWYIGTVGASIRRMTYGNNRALKVKIVVEYDYGVREEIFTDEDWSANIGEVVYSDLFNGEYVDKRLSLGDFSAFEYDDAGWSSPDIIADPNRTLTPADCPPVRVLRDEALKPVSTVKSKKSGAFIYDFGQNFAGIVRAVVSGGRGAMLRFRHGEALADDGELYVKNLRKADACDYLVLAGSGREVFEPLFTYHGFRYLEITIEEGDADILEIYGVPVTTELKKSGDFSCSDKIVNRIYSNAVWGQKSNFVSIPTDCPQRDERLGWTGDAQIFCRSALYNTDAKSFYEAYLRMVRVEQWEDGTVTMFAPTINGSREAQVRAGGWGDAICIIPTELYEMYGDISVIKDNIESAKAWVRCCRKHSKDFIKHEAGEFGDWLSIYEVTDISVVSTLFFANSARLAAYMCNVVGDPDENEFRLLYESIKKAFLGKFVGKDGRILSDTQSCYILGYAFGVIEKQYARDNLLRKLADVGTHITSGFLGIKYFLPVLCELDLSELAYELITQTTFPSWGNCALNGATTIWERWNSYTPENGFFDPEMNSFNHYSLGSFSEWLFSHVLGINVKADKTDGIRLVIRPFIDATGRIKNAQGYYDTVKGRVAVKWRSDGGRVIFDLTLPDDLKFECSFPNYDVVLKSRNGDSYCYVLKAAGEIEAIAK